jgi:hypothetical protein
MFGEPRIRRCITFASPVALALMAHTGAYAGSRGSDFAPPPISHTAPPAKQNSNQGPPPGVDAVEWGLILLIAGKQLALAAKFGGGPKIAVAAMTVTGLALLTYGIIKGAPAPPGIAGNVASNIAKAFGGQDSSKGNAGNAK